MTKYTNLSDTEFWRLAGILALGAVASIYRCKKCGYPVIHGYCCEHCGDVNPSEKDES